MRRDEQIFIALIIVIAAIFGFVAGCIIYSIDLKAIKKEAVEHGYAEWATDSSGNSKFTWKPK